jgi:signal transduction histidine kinase
LNTTLNLTHPPKKTAVSKSIFFKDTTIKQKDQILRENFIYERKAESMNNADEAILESVDEALSSSSDIDKDKFYQTLENEYNVKREEIADNFEVFHKALKEIFPTKRYAVERKMMLIFHNHAKNGTYKNHDEIIALTRLLELFMKDIELQITKNEAHFTLSAYAEQTRRLIEESKEEINASQHLAAIGRVAGMVGHDIRNPLQAIVGDVYLLKSDVEDMPDGENKKSMLESIDSINQNVEYINKIFSDLQDYARKTDPNIEEVNFETIFQTLLSLIRIPENIQLIYSVEPHVELKTDKEYLKRILTNLITNAVQAMPKGGKLTVTATRQKKEVHSDYRRGYG